MQENIWKWHSSGSIFNYTNWYTGEPNNAGGDQDCLKMWSKAIHNYKWDDDDCSDKFRTICQIKGKDGYLRSTNEFLGFSRHWQTGRCCLACVG